LEIAPAAGADGGPSPPRRAAAGQLGMVQAVAAPPDGATVAGASRDGRPSGVGTATRRASPPAAAPDGPGSRPAVSPHPGTPPLSQIRLARLADATVVDLTDGRFSDTEPVFSKDGQYLAFLSRRSFDPIYDAHFFDMSFPYGCRPYLVTLAAPTSSPFAPQTEGRPVGEDDGKRPGGGDVGEEAAGDPATGEGDTGEPGGAERPTGDEAAGEGAAEGKAAGERAEEGKAAGERAGDDDRAGAAGRRRDDHHPVVKVDVEGLPDRVVGVPVEES